MVKARNKRDSAEISYYEHKAVSVSALPVGDEWCVVLSPGYAFTRNGYNRLIGNELINSLSTRRAAKDFNANVHNDLTFWLAMLSGDGQGPFVLKPAVTGRLADFAPEIFLGEQLAGGSVNSAAFDDLAAIQASSDEELDILDEELAAMAEMQDLGASLPARASAATTGSDA